MTVSTAPATPAVAVGEPVPGDVNATVLADRLCGALPPGVMRTALPVGTAAAGVSETVIVTALVSLATLLREMDGAFVPRDPLTMATMVPVALCATTIPSLSVTAAATFDNAACASNAFCTVPGSERLIV